MTTRTGSTPIFATVQLLAALVGVPMWLIIRIAGGDAFGPFDVFLLGAVVGWFVLVNGLRSRDVWLPPFGLEQGRPTAQAHALIEQSIFGVGAVRRDTTAASLHTLVVASAPHPEQLPAPLPADPSLVPVFGAEEEEVRVNLRPVVHVASERAGIDEIGITELRTVVRGDTYWSIASEVFGDGRQWTTLEELNLGREVAPGVVLDAGADLRIGWSILVPMSTDSSASLDDLMEDSNVR